MSNNGKYIDRNPDVKAAGKLFTPVEHVGDSLKNYSIEEAAFNAVSLKCKKLPEDTKGDEVLRYSQFLPKDGLKDLFSPDLRKSRFIAFKEKFSEDMYFKKAEIGKPATLPSKPREFTNENFVYGLKNETTENLYELVFPNKTNKEVESDFMKWHDKYLISHRHFLPSERIQRHYNNHFEPQAAYGVSTNADETGLRVKKCLQLCNRMAVINKGRTKFQNNKFDRYSLALPPDRTFGIETKNHNNISAKTLIENVEPCAKNIEITEALSHIHHLRRLLFNRCNFHMNDLRTVLKIPDENGTGYVRFSVIMRLLRSLQVRANEQKIRAAISLFQMFKDGNDASELVSTEEFWKMLHLQYPLPRIINSAQLSKMCAKNSTTYRSLCSDRDKFIIAPQTLSGLSGEYDPTTAGILLAPDVSLRYGLTSKDFEVLRPKEEMKIIFKNLLSHNFDQVWQFACCKKVVGSSRKMSVNEFRNYLDEYNRQL